MKKINRYIEVDEHKLRIVIYQPDKIDDKTTGILWIHGGGFAVGMPEMVMITRALALVKKYHCIIVAPDYRLSFLASYPAALNDCHGTLKYMVMHADELHIRKDQIMVGGESAGGGLCAALCMYERDIGKINIAFQMPLYPMLDDRDTPTSIDNHAPVWNTRLNHWAWKKYLRGIDEITPYAAPARQNDHHDLPPCYTMVGDIEPFYHETLVYIYRLKRAGIPVTFDIYHDWYHGYDIFHPYRKITKLAIKNFEDAFVYAKDHYFRSN